MRALTFASRNTKELTRDLLTMLFGIETFAKAEHPLNASDPIDVTP